MKREVTFEVEQRLKRLCNEAYPDYCLDPDYDLTWHDQLEEFKQAYRDGSLSDRFIAFSLGEE